MPFLNSDRTALKCYLADTYLIHDKDYAERDGVVFIPFYMTPFVVTG